ncbi:MAG TPA: cupin domain-containing protein [Woeseiaceae bacterium]|jgi:mannose-6-phosphate isomerase-like protein (cupin superfamily)|nr:cupin domain-containing protein [Woeseiaceae bacterium]
MASRLLAVTLIMLAFSARAETAREALERLAGDYARDPSLMYPVTFGVRIGADDWTVSAVPVSADKAASVTVTSGAPEVPTFVYSTNAETFARVASGDLHALTAMAQAHASDPTPMQLETVNGWEMDDAGRAAFLSVSFHFFTTGQPEVVLLGPAHALPAHGGEALPIYYDEHLRTSWYGIAPGQHINADPRDQVNDFPSLFIVIKGGTARARLGGREMTLEDNEAILVPKGVAHEFWNPGDERATLLLIMFGESA